MKTQCGDVRKKYGVLAGVLTVAVAFVPLSVQAGGSNRLLDLEQQVQQLQQQLDEMRAETAQNKQAAEACCAENSDGIRKLDERVTNIENFPTKWSTRNKNMVFFRGGYAELPGGGRGFESFTETHGDILGFNPFTGNPTSDNDGNDNGWYVGAAIEHSMSDDLWGLWKGTEVLGEIGLEYKRWGTENATEVVPTAECALLFDELTGGGLSGGPGPSNCLVTGDITLTMFTVNASPKIKFLQDHPWKIRPWIIPIGLDFHVISPPSDSATYLDIGMQFGAGVEFEFIKGMKLGIDGRYHLASDESNPENDYAAVVNRNLVELLGPGGAVVTRDSDIDNDFWTIGGYLGFTF